MQSSKQQILCVDNHASRNLAVFLLEQAGYEVATADSVAEGLQLAQSSHFDLYLLNHRLLNGTEIELCDRLSEFRPNTPLLFYSTVTYPFRQRPVIRCGIPSHRKDLTSVSEVVKSVSRLLNTSVQPTELAKRAGARLKRESFIRLTRVLAGIGLGATVALVLALLQGRRSEPAPRAH